MTTLMAIGGNEKPALLQEFVARAGGEQADLVVLPQPSALESSGATYAQLFAKLGARSCRALEFRSRADAENEDSLDLIGSASGIFISGGTQMRLPVLIGATAMENALLRAFRAGVIVGGTSAGAALMSRLMIASGKAGPSPREGSAQLSGGLGFSERIVFDQHFRQKDRLGRLLYAIAANPVLLGVGIDENTAAIVQDDALITVSGAGAVTIVDGSHIESSDAAELKRGQAAAVSNVLLDVLTKGCRYDILARKASIPGLDLLPE